LDLKKLQGDASLLVYENAAWAPARAKVAAEVLATDVGAGLGALRSLELTGSPPVLPAERTPTRFSGPLEAGDNVLLSEASSPRWQLRAGGEAAPRKEAFGWANSFTAPASGNATLHYRTSVLRYGAIAVQVALWAIATRLLVIGRRRRSAVLG
ncbi:MAG: hypothetical protein ACR2MO_12055, partial [Acidimicrobiales bacterium]